MCVIGYAPRNVTIDDETVETMFYNNPDGAGIMWKPEGDKPIEIRKGFFTAEALLRAWHKVPFECEKAIHCRIATAGKISAQCCHPFPVRETTGSMKSRSDSTDMAVMHNGILSLTDPPKGIDSPFSDSMMFAKEILYPLKCSNGAMDNVYVQTMLEDEIDASRMLIFRQNKDTIRLGDWVKDGKCFFSNNSYNSKWYSYTKYTTKASTKTTVAPVAPVKKTKTSSKKKKTTKSSGVEQIAQSSTVVQQPANALLPSDKVKETVLLDDETRFLEDQAQDVLDVDEVEQWAIEYVNGNLDEAELTPKQLDAVEKYLDENWGIISSDLVD